jgi:hypothetical protein
MYTIMFELSYKAGKCGCKWVSGQIVSVTKGQKASK